MASEIKVDTIVNAGGDNDTGIDLATNDQILLKVANATKLTMNSTVQTTIVGEGGTNTTSVQQGLTKHWASFNGSGTVALFDSFNNASLTDNGTGDYTLGITNDFRAAAAYCMAGSVYDNGNTSLGGVMSDTPSAGSLQLSTAVGSSFVDRTYTMVQSVGDLA